LTPVVFLASHTTNQSLNDSFFFSEEKGKIHRFWKVLNNLGVVNIYFQENQEIETLKQNIISGFSNQHNTKYSVSIDCFFSLPCDSVATLKNIFGDSAFVNLCQLSKESFLERLKANTSRKPVIITFQKDVFNTMSNGETVYSQDLAFNGILVFENSEYKLIGLPAMRWIYAENYKNTLQQIFNRL